MSVVSGTVRPVGDDMAFGGRSASSPLRPGDHAPGRRKRERRTKPISLQVSQLQLRPLIHVENASITGARALCGIETRKNT
jgi:hypothetical protein